MQWTKASYEASVTSRCWSCTPCDAGWEESAAYGFDIPASAEMRAIFAEEMALEAVPEWAREIANRMIQNLPMCGHYTFPQPVLCICAALRKERCPQVVCAHYAADPERKRLMSYYVYCLDAWQQGAPVEVAEAELALRPDLGRDWPAILRAIYRTLGDPAEPTKLLAQRVIHRQRWWIKTLLWADDRRDQYHLDAYLGDVRGDEEQHSAYGNPPFGDPYFAELRLPDMQELSARIRELGHGDLLGNIEHSHLCGPKAFRHLEKTVLEIGAIVSGGEPSSESILQCEDTYPDFAAYGEWYKGFMASLSAWLEGDEDALPELGPATPVRHWLARVLRLKLELYEEYNPFGRLVGARAAGKSGAGRI